MEKVIMTKTLPPWCNQYQAWKFFEADLRLYLARGFHINKIRATSKSYTIYLN